MSDNNLKEELRYKGLTPSEVEESRKINGSNMLTPPERDPWWKLYLEKFDDPIIRILLVAVALSLIIGFFEGGFIESIGIIIAVFLATFIGFINEYKANKEFDILNQINDKSPTVAIRDSNYMKIPKDEIVVGDIVVLETGMEAPADGEILEAISLRVNESKLTGESLPAYKMSIEESKKNPDSTSVYEPYKVLGSTLVSNGYGIMRITAVGDKTEIGKTAKAALEETKDKTPLEKQLDNLAKIIGVIAFGMAGLTFFALSFEGIFLSDKIALKLNQWVFLLSSCAAFLTILLPVWLPIAYDFFELIGKEKEYPEMLEGNKKWFISAGCGIGILLIAITISYFAGVNFSLSMFDKTFLDVLNKFILFFMVAVTLIVVAVPEGLPMATVLSLAYSMRKMMKENVLVKRMLACETIGAVTTICTDKTGTLTLNEMRVFEADVLSLDDLVAEAISVNSTANLNKISKTTEVIGNPTEGSLLLWLDENGFAYSHFRSQFHISSQIPFSSINKYMLTVGQSKVLNKEVLYVKGAPEIILNKCNFKLTKDKEDNIEAYRKKIEDNIMDYQKRGMRTLGIAYKIIENDPESNIEEIPSDLVWLGFVAINDPVRPEVKSAIQMCRIAGIEVKIVTGDNSLTASEIGNQIEIEGENQKLLSHHLMEGDVFAKLENPQLTEASKQIKILSRAKPDDKRKMVRALKESGEVVAVTGDGTNDAPALNSADVGISMGISGTSIAKEVAQMVLLDDSFKSIVTGVMWGRALYLNIQKFIVFQLTINVTALLVALTGPFIGIELPFTVTQMLWINLIMDTFAALALSTEPPRAEIMKNKPRSQTAFVVTKQMASEIFSTGIIFVVFLIFLLLYFKHNAIVETIKGTTESFTLWEKSIFFSIFVFLQLWNLLNARMLGLTEHAFKGLAKNKAFVLIVIVIFIGQILMVQIGGDIFRTMSLSIKEWLVIIFGTSIVLWIGELKRFMMRKIWYN